MPAFGGIMRKPSIWIEHVKNGRTMFLKEMR